MSTREEQIAHIKQYQSSKLQISIALSALDRADILGIPLDQRLDVVPGDRNVPFSMAFD